MLPTDWFCECFNLIQTDFLNFMFLFPDLQTFLFVFVPRPMSVSFLILDSHSQACSTICPPKINFWTCTSPQIAILLYLSPGFRTFWIKHFVARGGGRWKFSAQFLCWFSIAHQLVERGIFYFVAQQSSCWPSIEKNLEEWKYGNMGWETPFKVAK